MRLSRLKGRKSEVRAERVKGRLDAARSSECVDGDLLVIGLVPDMAVGEFAVAREEDDPNGADVIALPREASAI